MSIAKEIKKIQPLVKELLELDSRYRDCDKMLSARIWAEQMGGYGVLEKISAMSFLTEYVKLKGKLFSQESIGRARRKLQEENVELRGKSYKKKKAKTKDVKDALGY